MITGRDWSRRKVLYLRNEETLRVPKSKIIELWLMCYSSTIWQWWTTNQHPHLKEYKDKKCEWMPQRSPAIFSKGIPKLSALILMAGKINCGQYTSTRLSIDKFVDCIVHWGFVFNQSLKPTGDFKIHLV